MSAHCAQFVVRRPPCSAPLCIHELPLLSFTQYSLGQERHGSAEQRDDRMSSARALPWAAPPAGSHQAGPARGPTAGTRIWVWGAAQTGLHQKNCCVSCTHASALCLVARWCAAEWFHLCPVWSPSAQCGLLAPDAVAHGGLDDISHPVNASFGFSRPGKRAAKLGPVTRRQSKGCSRV